MPTRRDFGTLLGAVALAGCARSRGRERLAQPRWQVTGTASPGLAGFDAAVEGFMRRRHIPCGALAVGQRGRLLLSRGYTFSPDPRLRVEPTSLFRIASISKPVTATAVLGLVQDGRLRLSDRLTDVVDLPPPPGRPADPRLREVTVLDLLRHRGGWDRARTFDPMFRDHTIAAALGVGLPIRQADIMRYMTGFRLYHSPGAQYAYSNYGYLLLGRIIEKTAGMPYGAYVQQRVLAPLQITRMRLGRTLVRAPGEVLYSSDWRGKTVMDASGKEVPAPYGGFNLENMDSHGGWLATAADLVRLATVYDGTTTVLNRASISQALAAPDGADSSYYGLGWEVRPVKGGHDIEHTGALSGTSALLFRGAGGLAFAVLFDQWHDRSGQSYDEIGPLLRAAAGAARVGTGSAHPAARQ